MNIAMIFTLTFVTGVAALIMIVVGFGPYFKALKNEDAEKAFKAKRWFSIASLFLTAFVILLVILVIRVLFSVL